MEFRLLDTAQLSKLELPSAQLSSGLGLSRRMEWFHIDNAMAEPLLTAFEAVQEFFPLGFSTVRTFLTDSQQQELFADYKTGKTKVLAAPSHFSAREIGRAIDIAISAEFCRIENDDGDFDVLTIQMLKHVMEPLGFICVDDGRIEPKPWKPADGYLHLEYWADVGPLTQAQRDEFVKQRLAELY